ncbi:MAG: hypothetical protein LH628_15155 [Microcoleus sp. CAN_BIN18]|nr:hypothetical protein [Microcoleus sp. CAN_BIN18]
MSSSHRVVANQETAMPCPYGYFTGYVPCPLPVSLPIRRRQCRVPTDILRDTCRVLSHRVVANQETAMPCPYGYLTLLNLGMIHSLRQSQKFRVGAIHELPLL